MIYVLCTTKLSLQRTIMLTTVVSVYFSKKVALSLQDPVTTVLSWTSKVIYNDQKELITLEFLKCLA